MIDFYAEDLRTLTHECAHASVAVYLGRQLIRIIGHRHYARDDGEAGSVEWLGDPSDPFGDAVVCFAGRIAAEGLDALVPSDTHDEREAQRLCPLGLDRARTEAWILLQRRDVRAAVTALAHALGANGYVMNGVAAEGVIRLALGRERVRA